MTCIVGLVNNGKVYIGGDSAASNWSNIHIQITSKVFKNGGFLFGICGSIRMGNLLQYNLKIPKVLNDVDVMRYMCTDFINSVRSCLKKGGFTRVESNEETGGSFLVAYNGRLFRIGSDFQVAEFTGVGYASIGSGQDFALGSLHTSDPFGWAPKNRIKRALDAASFHSPTVAPPYSIMSV